MTIIFTVLISEGNRTIQQNGCEHVLSRAVSSIFLLKIIMELVKII